MSNFINNVLLRWLYKTIINFMFYLFSISYFLLIFYFYINPEIGIGVAFILSTRSPLYFFVAVLPVVLVYFNAMHGMVCSIIVLVLGLILFILSLMKESHVLLKIMFMVYRLHGITLCSGIVSKTFIWWTMAGPYPLLDIDPYEFCGTFYTLRSDLVQSVLALLVFSTESILFLFKGPSIRFATEVAEASGEAVIGKVKVTIPPDKKLDPTYRNIKGIGRHLGIVYDRLVHHMTKSPGFITRYPGANIPEKIGDGVILPMKCVNQIIPTGTRNEDYRDMLRIVKEVSPEQVKKDQFIVKTWVPEDVSLLLEPLKDEEKQELLARFKVMNYNLLQLKYQAIQELGNSDETHSKFTYYLYHLKISDLDFAYGPDLDPERVMLEIEKIKNSPRTMSPSKIFNPVELIYKNQISNDCTSKVE